MFKIFTFLIHLLLTHGYLALFLWSILEGEIGLMMAGWLASKNEVFSYPTVALVAISGAVIGDHLLYGLGRFFAPKAKRWLRKYEKKRVLIQRWLHKYGALLVVFERFIYGTHIPALLSLGISKFPYLKFLLFDLVGIVLWVVTFVSVGFYFGHSSIELILFVQKNILWVIFVIGFFILYKKAQE